MTTLRTAAQQALEFLEFIWRDVHLNDYASNRRDVVDEALRAALAQEPAVQEPVALLHSDGYWTRKDTKAGRAFSEHIRTIARVDAYVAAPQPRPAVQELVGYQYQSRDGNWCNFLSEKHYADTKADGTWPIRAIYAAKEQT